MLFDANLPEESFRELLAAFERLAAAGDPYGQYSLGWAHEQGELVPRDLKKALYWYMMAAAQGDTEAEQAVARLCRVAPD
jgi:TPR repeat protein